MSARPGLPGPSRRGVALALAATVLWAAGSLLTKHSLLNFAPLTLLSIELAASVCALGLLRAFVPRPEGARKSLFRLALPGLLQPGLAYALSFVGLKWLDSVSVETLLWSAEGVAMIPFAVLFLGESAPPRAFPLGMAALCGIALVTIPSGRSFGASPMNLAGSALIAAAVLSACSYTVLAQRDLRDHGPLLLTTLHHLAGLAAALAIVPLAPASGEAPTVTAGAVLEACLAGVCLFALPFWLFLRSIQLIGSSAAAQFLPAVPILTIVLARFLLRETLTLE